jgi:hypothetical protein
MIKLQLINAAIIDDTDTKIIMTSCQTFYCINEKGKCDHEKHGKVRQHWRLKRKKKHVYA